MGKKKKKLKRLLGYSMTIGGAALIGERLPPVAGTPVKRVATVGSRFVAPMSAVTGAGVSIETLKKLNIGQIRKLDKQYRKIKRRSKK